MSVERSSYQLANQVRFFGKEIAEKLLAVSGAHSNSPLRITTALEKTVDDLEAILISVREIKEKA